MALRQIREIGEPCLTKACKSVREVNSRTRELIDDMLDTMYDAEGVGLAAPQVGVLKRIAVIDAGGDYQDQPIILINPEILETDGEQTDYEGCLSVPGKVGRVTRPNYVRVKSYDMDMNEYTVEGEGLLARALLHEIEHLDGHMYVEKVSGPLLTNEEFAELMKEQEENEEEQ
ncbi:MAG: peptide deformylase [Lachnospiraceae bacterium]|nr:peptide deformylase [Lachnospiraceae bacterium]